MGDGTGGPFDEGLADEFGAGPSPVDPVLVSAAFGDGRNAGVLLKCSGVDEAIALLAESGKQPGSKDWAGAGEMSEEMKVWQEGAASGDVGVETSDAGVERAELRQEDGDDEAGRLDDGDVGGQSSLGLDGIYAAVDGGGAPDAVGVEEVDQGFASGALGVSQRRPPLEEGGEDVGLLVAKPVENLRK